MKNRQNIDKNDKKRSLSNTKGKIDIRDKRDNRDIRENLNKDKGDKEINNENLKEFQKGSDFINSLIHEYLIKRDYIKSLDVFQEEINAKIKSKQYYSSKFADVVNESTIEYFFNSGKKNEFFKIWNRLIPSHIKAKEFILEKLEFFLQIYFAVYPLLPSIIGEKKNIKENNLKETKIRMQDFKLYLESKEIEMSKTTEYLAYYALPYVQNPREHPSYKQIFTPDWIRELREKLKNCLISYVPIGKYPLLYDMYITCDANAGGENKMIKGKALYNFLDNYQKNYESSPQNANTSELLKSENKMTEDYNKLKRKEEAAKITLIESQKKWTNFSLDLLKISFELISNFNKLKSGEEIASDYLEITSMKLNKYENFLKKNAEELDRNNSFNRDRELETNENVNIKDHSAILDKTNINKSVNQSMVQENSNNRSAINQSIHINYDPSFMIDMPSVKSTFAKVNAHGYDTKEFYERVNFILREIRLRISRRKFIKLKQMTLCAVTLHDILGLRSKHVKIFPNLLGNVNTNLETLKLMNAITNENRGRTYILSKPSMIEETVKIMFRQEFDSEVRQNCLGIIQKFTLRSDPQKKLIDLDVIGWITNVFITESGNLSDYTLEYGLALLMNLSLRVSGRDKCEKVSEKLLKIMISYFHNESVQVRTCINGTLYSLLKRKKMKIEAKMLGLEKMLIVQLQNPNEQMKKQIQYILDELNNDTEIEEKVDEEFEDENYGEEEDEIFDDEYYEEDSISDDMLNLHYQILEVFIIKNAHENEIEIQNVADFINSPNNGNRNMVNNNNFSASIRRDEYDRPLRRPTTPMTNLSSTSNSQIFNNQERKSIASKIKSNLRGLNIKVDLNNDKSMEMENIGNLEPVDNNDQLIANVINFDLGKQDQLEKDVLAFEKKDKLARTPPTDL